LAKASDRNRIPACEIEGKVGIIRPPAISTPPSSHDHSDRAQLPRRRYIQRDTASLLGEGCAVLAYRRTGRADSLPPNSRWAAPICPDLIFDRHNGFAVAAIYRVALQSRKRAFVEWTGSSRITFAIGWHFGYPSAEGLS